MFNITIFDAYAFVIVLMCLWILYALWKINKIHKSIEISGLYFIPISFIILYLWIGLFTPLADVSRPFVRTVLFFDFGDAIAILIGHMHTLKGNK